MIQQAALKSEPQIQANEMTPPLLGRMDHDSLACHLHCQKSERQYISGTDNNPFATHSMFSSFDSAVPRGSGVVREGSATPSSLAMPRPRRHQVARACNYCRAMRIKCDDKYPCRNCRMKGRPCSEKNESEVRTYSLAIKYALGTHWLHDSDVV